MSSQGRLLRRAAWVVGMGWALGAMLGASAPTPPAVSIPPLPEVSPAPPPSSTSNRPDTGSLLNPNVQAIDLPTALRLTGVQNPELLLARQRVVEAVALRQLTAARFLPTINAGTNYDSHTGVLQQSDGNILSVQRSALYLGAGADAVAAGTVNIPGIVLFGNVADQVYAFLASRQVVRQREMESVEARNQALLRVCDAYCELLRAEGRLSIAVQVRDAAAEVARITADYARIGQGRQADADRAATELGRRRAALRAAEGQVQVASARLCRVLNLSPTIRLHPTDGWVVPLPVVPDPIPLEQLLAIALLQRPELAARRAAIRVALTALDGARMLPFSPTVLIGFSAGGFGGGSNLVRPIFGGFSGRTDLDVMAYWTLQNLGIGNVAMIDTAQARWQIAKFEELAAWDRIREEIAEAYARSHARFAEIAEYEQAVRTSNDGFQKDLDRARQAAGLPIEVLDSLRLLRQSEDGYLDAIVDYNQAHFQLYVAVGQPPADMLARQIPTNGGGMPSNVLMSRPPQPPTRQDAGSPFARPEGR